MWVRSNSQVSDNIFQITTPVSSHFLICGIDKCALVDSGVLSLGILDAVKSILGERPLDYLLITHGDADHVGGIAELRKACPQLTVVSGKLLKEKLEDTELLNQLYSRNHAIAFSFEAQGIIPKGDWVSGTRIDKVLEDSESLDLGNNLTVRAYTFPGHTLEQMGYYVASDKALAAGEAFGHYSGKNKEIPAFRFYSEYLDSLNKASKLSVRLLSLPHNGVLTGDLGLKFLYKSIASAQAFSEQVKERIDGGETVDEIYAGILQEWKAEDIAPDGPFVLEQGTILRDMITSLTGK